MAYFKFLNANGQWEYVDVVGGLKYTPQSLTETEQLQAKSNLGISVYGETEEDYLILNCGTSTTVI